MRNKSKQARLLAVLIRDTAISVSVKPEKLFLAISLLFGLIFVFIVPPFKVPDEYAHFLRSYQITEGRLTQQNFDDTSGSYAPAGLVAFYNGSQNDNTIQTHPVSKESKELYDYKKKMQQLWDVRLDHENRITQGHPGVAAYSPLTYIPQAIGVAVSKTFTSHVLVMFYVGRIFNLLAYVGLMYFAIRMLPRARLAFTAVALLPMSLFLAASFSADSVAFGVAGIFTALLVKMYFMRDISRNWWIILLLSCVLLALSKQVYFLFSGATIILLFDSKTDRFIVDKNKLTERLKWIFIILGTVVAAVAIWFVVNRGISTDTSKSQQLIGHFVDPTAQKATLLHDPFVFVGTLFNTTLTHFGDGTVTTFFGAFGLMDAPLPYWAMYILAITLFLLFGLRSGSEKPIKRLPFLIPLAVAVISYIAIMAVLFIVWTVPGSPAIQGYQGRYSIPLLILVTPFLVGLYRHTIRTRYIFASLFSILVVSILTIHSRY